MSARDEQLIDLLMEHADRVDSVISRRIPPRYRATIPVEDVRQEVWRAAFKAYERFEPNGAESFRHWLMRLTMSKVLDAIKTAARSKRGGSRVHVHAFSVQESGVRDAVACVPAEQPTPSGELTRDEGRQALWQAIDRLTPQQRRAIEMYHFEGASRDDIAHELGVSVTAVMNHLAKGRRRLRELLVWEPETTTVSARKNPLAVTDRGAQYEEV